MLRFKIERGGRPYYEQIRDQVVLAIESGQLRPGDKLPTLQEISDTLHVSKNTGIKAYQELERNGWIKMSRRAGTIVQPTQSAQQKAIGKTNQGMDRVLEGLDLLFEAGAPAKNVQVALTRMIADRWSSDYCKTDCIALVTDDPFGIETDLADVKQATGMPVRWVSIREVLEFGVWALGDTRRIKAVVTTFYRFTQVRSCLGSVSFPIFPLSVATDPAVAQNAESFNRPGVRVAMIATEATFFVVLSLAVQQFLYHTEVIGRAALQDEQQVRDLVSKADLIAGNYWLTDPRGVSQITKGKPVLAFGTRVDPGSLQLLKQVIIDGQSVATPSGEPT